MVVSLEQSDNEEMCLMSSDYDEMNSIRKT